MEGSNRPTQARRRRLILALAVGFPAVFVLVVTLALTQLRSQGAPGVGRLSAADRLVQAEAGGTVAPPFRLPRLDGQQAVALEDFAGSVVVLNFWASWCVPCREEAPHLQAVWEEYRERDVQFLGVNHQDQRAAALAFQREFGITFPSAFDPAGELALRYQLVGFPSTLVIDQDGRIAYRFLGKVDAATLRAALDLMIDGAGT
ncbi:MAG: TlpA family protein disulfide reductase [Actinomycetota bacterium]